MLDMFCRILFFLIILAIVHEWWKEVKNNGKREYKNNIDEERWSE